MINRVELAQYMDHTLLKPDATPKEITQLVEEALQWHTYAVCINSAYVKLASQVRDGSHDLKVAATIGFPLGQSNTVSKIVETQEAIAEGADEIDVVWNLGWYLGGDRQAVQNDIKAVVKAAGSVPVKVILETARLTPEQIQDGSRLAVEAGAHTVKTSTGFGFSGASVQAVQLMRNAVGPKIGVKASGGIHSYQEAINLIEAGATRLGLSKTLSVLQEAPMG